MKTTWVSQNRDSGLTLVELVVVVVLIGVVSSVIAAAVIVILRSEEGVVASTAESHDTRQVVSYLPQDIESGPSRANAYRATIGGAAGDHGSGCADAGNDNVLRIDITDRRLDLVDKRIAYRLVATSDPARLDRYECTFDGTNWVADEVLNIADYLDATASPIVESEVVVSNPADPIVDQEVVSVELRYVQRGDSESIVAAPREEQFLGSSGICGTDPLEAASGIASFIEGDVELHGTTVKSTLFVGGALTFHGGTVAQGTPDPVQSPVPGNIGLLVGSVDWANSTGELSVKPHFDAMIETGPYYTPDSNGPITETASTSSPRIKLGASAIVLPPGPDRVIVPGEAFAELRACSDRLAELPDSCNNGACAVHAALPPGYSGTATDASDTRLDLEPGKANAFNIDEANLDDLQSIQLKFVPGDEPTVGTPLIINVRSVVGGTVDFEAPDIQGSGANSVYIVWNFPNADFVNILGGDELRGTLLAPYAAVTSHASIQGGVIANRFEMFGSSLNDVRSFKGVLGW